MIGKRTTFEPGKIFESPAFANVYYLSSDADYPQCGLEDSRSGIGACPTNRDRKYVFVHVYDWLIFGFPLTEAHHPNSDQNFKLAVRTGIRAVRSFYVLPIPVLLKPVLCLLVFAPIPLFGVINSVIAGMEEEAVGSFLPLAF